MANASLTQPLDKVIDVDLLGCQVAERVVSVTTLGPAGTSSEVAAGQAAELLSAAWSRPSRVLLYDSFEDAAAAVGSGEADAVVVANAYAGINEIYMDPKLDLAAAFVRATPSYGLVARPGVPVPLVVRITSHPAPMRLIADLLPPAFIVAGVTPVSSTSVAARLVAEGEIDLALTNETSRDAYGLRFVSRTRPIHMLWSVFMRCGCS